MRFYLRALTVACLTLMTAARSLADVVYLKDGFAVHGKVKKEMELVIDPATGQPVQMFKASNQFLLDDRARYVVFGPKQVESADKDKDIREGHGAFQMQFTKAGNRGRPAMAVIGQAGPFNDKWERQVAITLYEDMTKHMRPGDPPINFPNLLDGRYKVVNTRIKQKIVLLSPYFLRMECVEYDWSASYLTSEFGPAVIVPLLRTHPEVAGKTGEPPDFEKEFRVYRFCTQAGWLTEANAELTSLRNRYPGMKDRLDDAERGLRLLREQKVWEEAELASRTGRHEKARELLGAIKLENLPQPLHNDYASLKAKYDGWVARLEQCRRAFAACYEDVVGPPSRLVARAVPAIIRELNYEVLDRLDAFIALGRQYELDVQAGKRPQYTADQTLAAAITGWVLGPAAAEASEETAERLWTAREAVLDLQRTAAPIDRSRKLTEICATIGLTVDECARLITLLPPPDPVRLEGPAPSFPLVWRSRAAFTQRPETPYQLVLPPEYHTYRYCPLLVVLPNTNETVAAALEPWRAEAARHGFALIGVDWAGSKNRYEYTVEEQYAVLDCIRDVLRSVQVDTDRVFLTGSGEGANAAFDIALSHPGEFAGVVPVNGRPRWYINQWCWRNAQNLPFYLVIGELSGDVRPWVAALAEKWIDRGYNSLLVMYRGRPTDFFVGEVPTIFDWMSRKRRANGFPELGRFPNSGYSGEEYQTFRKSDNRFYWVSAATVLDKFTMERFATQRTGTPAAIQATIREGNQVTAFTRGVSQLTLWFGRTYDPQLGARDMIDFSKPVRISVNGRQNWPGNGKPMTPKLEILLDDFCRRGDRRRLFFAKADFDKVQ